MVESQWKSRTYKIMAREEYQLDVIEQLLLHIESLGKMGSSRNLLIRVDGDGSGQILIKDEDDLYLSDYKKLKCEDPTADKGVRTNISGEYSLD